MADHNKQKQIKDINKSIVALQQMVEMHRKNRKTTEVYSKKTLRELFFEGLNLV
jgi:hypothetical protein